MKQSSLPADWIGSMTPWYTSKTWDPDPSTPALPSATTRIINFSFPPMSHDCEHARSCAVVSTLTRFQGRAVRRWREIIGARMGGERENVYMHRGILEMESFYPPPPFSLEARGSFSIFIYNGEKDRCMHLVAKPPPMKNENQYPFTPTGWAGTH